MDTSSLPIWSRYGDVDDQFVGVIAGAPSFELLQSCVSYSVTMDMVFHSLLEGVRNVASRARDGEVGASYLRALEKIEAARAHVRKIRYLKFHGFRMWDRRCSP
jgi:hypothetical protein